MTQTEKIVRLLRTEPRPWSTAEVMAAMQLPRVRVSSIFSVLVRDHVLARVRRDRYQVTNAPCRRCGRPRVWRCIDSCRRQTASRERVARFLAQADAILAREALR